MKQAGLLINSCDTLQNSQVSFTLLCWSSFPKAHVPASNHLACHSPSQQAPSQKGFSDLQQSKEEPSYPATLVWCAQSPLLSTWRATTSLISKNNLINMHTHPILSAFRAMHLPSHTFREAMRRLSSPLHPQTWDGATETVAWTGHIPCQQKHEEDDGPPDSWKLVMVGREDLLENLALTPVNVSWSGSAGLLEQSGLGTCVRRQGLQSSNHTSGVGGWWEPHTSTGLLGVPATLGYKDTFRQGACFVARTEKNMYVPVKGTG